MFRVSCTMDLVEWVLAACLLCSCLALGEAQGQLCYPDDLLALKEFAGNLTEGSVLTAWSNETSCCEWDGVVCGSTKSNSSVEKRVTMLILPNKGLKGVISSSLGLLDQLQVLDLSYNLVKGGLPIQLSSLKQLEVLDLSHNLLTGQVSDLLSGFLSIRSLNISSNMFSDDLSVLGGFPNLIAFNVSNNSFTGQFSSQVCSLSKGVQVLDLSVNHFAGSLECFSNCSASLQQLHLDSNLFSGPIPDLVYTFSHLQQLSISNNNISSELSEELSKLSSLKVLAIHENHFWGTIPDVFGNLTELEKLLAHSNRFSGPIPSTLSFCSSLRVLDLRNNTLTGPIDINFTGMPGLCTLDVASNHLSGPLPESLSICHKLSVLSLAKNNLTGQIPSSFSNLTALSFLSLSNNSFVDLAGTLSVLESCRNLTTLILTKNFIGEELPGNVNGFDGLRVFALGNCGLKGQIPAWLLNCQKLQVLDLSWNHLDGNIPSWIGQMESLFYLDFSNNSFSGPIPESLFDLKSLISTNSTMPSLSTSAGIPLYVKRNQSASGLPYNQASSFPPSIFLSNNTLDGTISPKIGNLKQLHVLDLSRNSISGIIPDSISEMQNLEILDLSFNNLSGSIPESLEKLTFLSKFSVANNHLEGQIPSGGQFDSFPNSSFEGNPGLCGGQFAHCGVDTSMVKPLGNQHGMGGKKFGRGNILVMTIAAGVGLALMLAIILLKMTRRDMSDMIVDVESDRSHRLSEALGPSKLVLFKNSCCNKEFTVADVLKSTNNFNQANIIGCGGFGLVYKGQLSDGTKVAIKRLSGDCGQMEREFQAEVEALSRAQHKNLVSLQGYCRHGNDSLLIYSYMENGSLDYWLHECVDPGSVLNWPVRLRIAQGAARGLLYLHKYCEPHVVHRDVKSSNILLDEKFEAHLADFGLSRLLKPYDTHVTTDLVGTLGYIPPEYSQTLTATCRGDVYSFGVVLLELITGRRPVEVCKGKNTRDLVSWVFQMKNEKRETEIIDSAIFDKDRENQLLDLLEISCKCLVQDPRTRPTIEEVVSWLDNIHVVSSFGLVSFSSLSLHHE